MRHFHWLLVCVIFARCGTNEPEDTRVDSSAAFREALDRIPLVQEPVYFEISPAIGFGIKQLTVDSIFDFNEHDQVIGLLKDTVSNYKILFLSVGDDIYPCVRIFNKEGQKVADHVLAFTDCAGADSCFMDSCWSIVEITEREIYRGIGYIEHECDTMAVKRFSKKFERRDVITFDEAGNMISTPTID